LPCSFCMAEDLGEGVDSVEDDDEKGPYDDDSSYFSLSSTAGGVAALDGGLKMKRQQPQCPFYSPPMHAHSVPFPASPLLPNDASALQ